jgi:hypothetical protein
LEADFGAGGYGRIAQIFRQLLAELVRYGQLHPEFAPFGKQLSDIRRDKILELIDVEADAWPLVCR